MKTTSLYLLGTGIFLFFSPACKRADKGEVQSLKIVRKADNLTRFESDPISKVIIDGMGGIVIPFNQEESKSLEAATSISEDEGHEMMFYIGNDLVFEMEVYPGIANGFVYFRGDIHKKISEMRKCNVRVIEVKEIPLSSVEVRQVLESSDK